VAVLTFSLFVMYSKDVLILIKNIINRTSNQSNQSTGDLDSISNEVHTPFLLLGNENEENSVRIEDTVPPASNNVTAIIKITFFFYQTVSILRI